MAQKNIIRKFLTFEISLLCWLFQKTVAVAERHKMLLLCFILLDFMPQTLATHKRCLHLAKQYFNKTRFRN